MRRSSASAIRWLALVMVMVVVMVAAACGPVAPPPSQAPTAGPPLAETAGPRAPKPAILSAQLVRIDDPELGGKDGVLVVLDTEVDAASLDARAVVVIRSQSGPTVPERAILAPANEADENRSVLLVGALHDRGASPSENATAPDVPTHVAVVGPLWAEDGRSLRGLGSPIAPRSAGPRAVAATVLPVAPGRCEGAAGVLRTYWSAELRGVEPSDLPRVRITTDGPASLVPSRFDDHAVAPDETGQDNVLDLCLDDPSLPRRVTFEAAAFRDPAGHPSPAAELTPRVQPTAPAPNEPPSELPITPPIEPLTAPAPPRPAPADPAPPDARAR